MRENVNRRWGTHMLGNTKMANFLAALTNKEPWFSQQEFLSADATRPPASQNTTSPLELDNRSETLKVHARGCKLRLRTKLLTVLETVNNSRALEDVEKINLMNSTKALN